MSKILLEDQDVWWPFDTQKVSVMLVTSVLFSWNNFFSRRYMYQHMNYSSGICVYFTGSTVLQRIYPRKTNSPRAFTMWRLNQTVEKNSIIFLRIV